LTLKFTNVLNSNLNEICYKYILKTRLKWCFFKFIGRDTCLILYSLKNPKWRHHELNKILRFIVFLEQKTLIILFYKIKKTYHLHFILLMEEFLFQERAWLDLDWKEKNFSKILLSFWNKKNLYLFINQILHAYTHLILITLLNFYLSKCKPCF
jgi:hypothetical protein